MHPTELKQILDDHAAWLCGDGGKCADLSSADLRGADLSSASLRHANFSGADLDGAALNSADLQNADLSRSRLYAANLAGACLQDATLQGAELHGVNLFYAYLRNADLRGARLPSVTAVLLADWGRLPSNLTALALAYDASCHPDPNAFSRWAQGSRFVYPYPAPPARSIEVERACNFQERREHWDPTLPAPRPYDLMVALIRECCRDSDFHNKEAK